VESEWQLCGYRVEPTDGEKAKPERKTKILTAGIHLVFRGLKFESDAEIGQKRMFFKGLSLREANFRALDRMLG
jgi:hypothetical protein